MGRREGSRRDFYTMQQMSAAAAAAVVVVVVGAVSVGTEDRPVYAAIASHSPHVD